MAHQDHDPPDADPGGPAAAPLLRGWMLTATDDRVLLSVRPAFLVVPAPGLPDGVQLRVRAAPEGTAAEVSQRRASAGDCGADCAAGGGGGQRALCERVFFLHFRGGGIDSSIRDAW